jgi:hypothetical protein
MAGPVDQHSNPFAMDGIRDGQGHAPWIVAIRHSPVPSLAP